MKKLILALVAVFALSSLAFAQMAQTKMEEGSEMTQMPAEETMTLKGTIIDNLCAGTQTSEQLTEFVKTHTKQCALMPECLASGYSILADGELKKFDKESSVKIGEFLKAMDSKLDVVVTVKKVGDELRLVSIGNQE